MAYGVFADVYDAFNEDADYYTLTGWKKQVFLLCFIHPIRL